MPNWNVVIGSEMVQVTPAVAVGTSTVAFPPLGTRFPDTSYSKNLKKWFPCAESFQALNFAATAVTVSPEWQIPQSAFGAPTQSDAVMVETTAAPFLSTYVPFTSGMNHGFLAVAPSSAAVEPAAPLLSSDQPAGSTVPVLP